MKKWFKYWFQGIVNYGFIFVVAHFIPVYFTQRTYTESDGYDKLSYKPNKFYYGHYRFQDNPYYQ